MISSILGWIIAGICLAALVLTWFVISYRELIEKRSSLESIIEQIKLHRSLYMQERGSENNTAARSLLDNKIIVCREVAREYDAFIKKPINLIPAHIMDFNSSEKLKEKIKN